MPPAHVSFLGRLVDAHIAPYLAANPSAARALHALQSLPVRA